MESISSVRAPSFYMWGRKRQAQWPFILRLGAAKATSARASAASGPLRFTFGDCKSILSESISSRTLRFTFGGCKGDLSESISSIRAPLFYVWGRQRQAQWPLSFYIWGLQRQPQREHQQHQGAFVLHLGAAKVTSARASAASGPLRFTLGGCKGNLSESISSITPSIYIWGRQRQAQWPLRFTFVGCKGNVSESISSIRAPLFYNLGTAKAGSVAPWFYIWGLKATSARASAASAPLRFTFGVKGFTWPDWCLVGNKGI